MSENSCLGQQPQKINMRVLLLNMFYGHELIYAVLGQQVVPMRTECGSHLNSCLKPDAFFRVLYPLYDLSSNVCMVPIKNLTYMGD